MQFDPSWSLAVVLIAGLAGFYIWYLLSQASLFDRLLAYPREHWGPLWSCSFCAGFWIVGMLLLIAGVYDPITHLAAAAVTGIMGSHSG